MKISPVKCNQFGIRINKHWETLDYLETQSSLMELLYATALSLAVQWKSSAGRDLILLSIMKKIRFWDLNPGNENKCWNLSQCYRE